MRDPYRTITPGGDNYYYEVARQSYLGNLLLDNNRFADPVLTALPTADAYGNITRSIYRSVITVLVGPPTASSTLSVSADVDGTDLVFPESSSFLFCLQILEWNTVIGQDCLGDYSELRDLQASAAVGPTGSYRILVYLYDYYGNHNAAVKVNRISYTTQ